MKFCANSFFYEGLWRFCKQRRIGCASPSASPLKVARPPKFLIYSSKNVATTVNHAEWAERPRSAQTGAAWNTQALFIEVYVFVFWGRVMHSNEGATSQSHRKLLREYVKRCGDVFIPVSSTARPAINRSHSAEDFLSVCVALWQRLPLDRGERTSCQGQSCALISVHHWTAGLTPVTFTPEASWRVTCVCVVFSIMFAPLVPFSSTAEASHLRLPIQYITPLSCPRLDSDGAVICDKQTEGGRGGGGSGTEH